MRRSWAFKILEPVSILLCCSRIISPPATQKVRITHYPTLDWSTNVLGFRDLGCLGILPESCNKLIVLGCDEIQGVSFYLGELQPPVAVIQCIHEKGEPPNSEYFRRVNGLDNRYRSFVIYEDGGFRLITKKSEFKAIFAPVESTDEALSYAMAMTSLQARFDLNPDQNVDYLVDVIEETHAEETPDGYLVYLFDWSHKMGCDTHPFYAVNVLVTPEGEVHEVERQEIYRSYACFDFDSLTLIDD